MKGVLLRLFIVGLLALTLWMTIFSHSVSSQQVESRLNNLEFNFRRLETQFNQLQLQLGQTRSQRSPNFPSQSTSSGRRLSVSERDKMFDRLATLIIELKQQVNQLTTRVTKLESR